MGGIYFKWHGLSHGWDSDVGTQSEDSATAFYGNNSVLWEFTGDGDVHNINYSLPSGSRDLSTGHHNQLYFRMKTNVDIMMSGARITDYSGNWFETENFETITTGDFQEVHVNMRYPDHDEGDPLLLCSGTDTCQNIGMSFFTTSGVDYEINIDMFRLEKDWIL